MKKIIFWLLLLTGIIVAQPTTGYLSGSDSILTKTEDYIMTNTVIFVYDSSDSATDTLVVEVYDNETGLWGQTGVFSGDGNDWYIVPGDGNSRWYYSTRWFTSNNLRVRRINVSGTLSRRTRVTIISQPTF